MIVTPAILPQNFEEVLEKISAINYVTTRVQIDLCDGEFGLIKTWLPKGHEVLPDDYEYEFDIMLNDWKTYTKLAIDLGASRIVAHVDSFSEAEANELLDILNQTGISLGVCVSNSLSVGEHINFIKFFEERYNNVFIQVMGIKDIGAQGQGFDENVISRIEELEENCPGLVIQVDGAMNNITAEKVKEAGANEVVSGSYVFSGEDVSERIAILEGI